MTTVEWHVSCCTRVVALLGLHDLLVRWNPYRGWWIGNGFGVHASDEFFHSRREAVRAAYGRLVHPSGRVLVEVGIHRVVAAPPSGADRFPTNPGSSTSTLRQQGQ